MSKLQFLNDYFTDRLMVAVEDIMKVVGDTLSEYQDETDRTKRENKRLRRRLGEVGLDAALSKCSQPVAPSLSVDWAVTEQHERSCTLDTQDTEPMLTAVKVELTERHRDRRGDVQLGGLEPDTPGSIFPPPCAERDHNQDSLNQPIFSSPCEKRDHDPDSLNSPGLMIKTVNADEGGHLPGAMLYQVKTEPGAVDYSTSEQHVEPLFFRDVNLESNAVQNKNSVSAFRAETGGNMSETAQPSTGACDPLIRQSEHSCPQCGKTFRHMSLVRKHLRMHTGEKPFCCAEQHTDGREEEELGRLEPDTPESIHPTPNVKSECNQVSRNQSIFPLSCVERECHQQPLNHSDLKMQIVNADEVRPPSSVMVYQVKTETGGMDYSTSELATKPLPRNILNPGRETVQSENSGSVNVAESGGPMSPSETEHSKEQRSMLRGESSLSCVYCGKVFFLVSRLRSHLKNHTEHSSFRCTVCGKGFSHAGNLNVHLRVHTGKKPYCCNVCGKCFNYSCKFKEHQRIHTGERPYCCTFCGKYFSQSGHLKAHVRTHTGEKPYRCPVCGNCFSHLVQIKRHLLTHTEKISFGNHSLGEELH